MKNKIYIYIYTKHQNIKNNQLNQNHQINQSMNFIKTSTSITSSKAFKSINPVNTEGNVGRLHFTDKLHCSGRIALDGQQDYNYMHGRVWRNRHLLSYRVLPWSTIYDFMASGSGFQLFIGNHRLGPNNIYILYIYYIYTFIIHSLLYIYYIFIIYIFYIYFWYIHILKTYKYNKNI